MGKAYVKYTKRNLQKVITAMNAIDDTVVKVGLFEEDKYGPENENYNVAQVAFWQEYGEGVPERPFVSYTFSDPSLLTKVRNTMKMVAETVFKGNVSSNRQLGKLGDEISNMMKWEIITWSTPSNSPSTIEKKGRDDPLVDTGKMWESVKHKVMKC